MIASIILYIIVASIISVIFKFIFNLVSFGLMRITSKIFGYNINNISTFVTSHPRKYVLQRILLDVLLGIMFAIVNTNFTLYVIHSDTTPAWVFYALSIIWTYLFVFNIIGHPDEFLLSSFLSVISFYLFGYYGLLIVLISVPFILFIFHYRKTDTYIKDDDFLAIISRLVKKGS